MADRVDEELTDYRERHNIASPWETKERVVVSITGARGSAVLIRRAARMAMRTKAELVGVHIRTDDSLTGPGSKGLAENRALLEDLGGRFVEVVGSDVAPALVQVARAENATQLVMGATHRNRFNELFKGSVINSAIRAAGGALDVHVIATDAESNAELREEGGGRETRDGEGEAAPSPREESHGQAAHRRYVSPLPIRRVVAALLIGAVGFPLLTLVLTSVGAHASLATALSSYLVLVVVVAAIGGVWPALLAALAGFLLSNYYFAPPVHTFTIGNAVDILALTMFLVTAGVVSVLVDLAARRTAAAVRARADARILARVAARLVSPEGNPLPALLDELRIAFHLDAAAVLRSAREPGEVRGREGTMWTQWAPVATSGEDPPLDPKGAPFVLPLTDRELLVLRGPALAAEDRDVLAAFAAQLSAALESDRLHAEAAEAGSLARSNQLRSALLAGVSHDLRAPLAAIKVASSSLLSDRLTFGPDETRTLLHAIDDESERLNGMVENLLDMSRIETGSVEVMRIPTQVGDVVTRAVEALGPRRTGVVVDVPDDLPPISTDPGLLERAIANLIDNGLVHGGGAGLRVEAGTVAGRVDVRVVDRGPGVPRDDRERILEPFERLENPDGQAGVGLGLAVARGFVEAIGGDLDLEDTPGGGCTWIVRLPLGVPGRARRSGEPDSAASLTEP